MKFCFRPSIQLEISMQGNDVAYLREADVERHDSFKRGDLLGRELQRQSLDVVLQMVDLAASDEREDVRSLAENIGERDGSDTLDLVLAGNLLERVADLDLLLGGFLAEEAAELSVLGAFFAVCLALILSSTYRKGDISTIRLNC